MTQGKSETVSLYVIEEQELYREVYRYLLPAHASIEIAGIAEDGIPVALLDTLTAVNPRVLLLSVKTLNVDLIADLEEARNSFPRMGIVILINQYSSQDVDLLRRLAMSGGSGMALFMKQSLDKIDHLCQTINAVSQGQVILDPPLATFLFAGKPESPFLNQLTTRELEILGLLSQGHTNASIAQTLFIDIKTVEHHLNSMYSKLKSDPDYSARHLRVSAAKLYLETMGAIGPVDSMLAAAGSR